MKTKQFDTRRIKYHKLSKRKNLLTLSDIHNKKPQKINSKKISDLAKKIISAKQNKSSIIFSFGAHAIRNGLTKYFEWFMNNRYVTHFATNGASAIHDWELAYQGKTLEDVKDGLEHGTFGLWEETNYNINRAINEGSIEDSGFGESIGNYISRCPDLHPYKEDSLFYSCHIHKIPITVHPGYGYDIIYLHPTSSGENIGRASQKDLLTFANVIENLSNGVYVSIGSAVMSPMIFEKCFAAAQNVKMQKGKKLEDFLVFCNDIAPQTFEEGKKDSNYFQRFQKTFSRVPNSEYLQCDNLDFIHSLKKEIEKIR